MLLSVHADDPQVIACALLPIAAFVAGTLYGWWYNRRR